MRNKLTVIESCTGRVCAIRFQAGGEVYVGFSTPKGIAVIPAEPVTCESLPTGIEVETSEIIRIRTNGKLEPDEVVPMSKTAQYKIKIRASDLASIFQDGDGLIIRTSRGECLEVTPLHPVVLTALKATIEAMQDQT